MSELSQKTISDLMDERDALVEVKNAAKHHFDFMHRLRKVIENSKAWDTASGTIEVLRSEVEVLCRQRDGWMKRAIAAEKLAENKEKTILAMMRTSDLSSSETREQMEARHARKNQMWAEELLWIAEKERADKAESKIADLRVKLKNFEGEIDNRTHSLNLKIVDLSNAIEKLKSERDSYIAKAQKAVELERRCTAYEEEQAAILPEDVSLKEYVDGLRKRIADAEYQLMAEAFKGTSTEGAKNIDALKRVIHLHGTTDSGIEKILKQFEVAKAADFRLTVAVNALEEIGENTKEKFAKCECKQCKDIMAPFRAQLSSISKCVQEAIKAVRP